MNEKKKILAISGSTRARSSNKILLNAILLLCVREFDITMFEGIADLPHFNPDLNDENTPYAVKDFRDKIRNADGIIICTPEYAHGVPGSLKNAIDWTVSTNEFYNKPTVLITASTDGRYAHNAMLEILKVIEAKNIDQLNLLIQFVNTKVNAENGITDEETLMNVEQLLKNFLATINEND